MANMYDYMAALACARIKIAKKDKDFKRWAQQEQILNKIAKRTKRTYRYVHSRAVGTMRKIEKVKEWSKKMDIWVKKHLTEEGNGSDKGC
jgi:adenosylmethionine-8-amino-7-oxononanoate aminotransferase